MIAKNKSLLLLLSLLLIATVRSEIPQATTNPFCPASANFDLNVRTFNQLEEIQFIASSFILKQDTWETIQLFVNKIETEVFRFIIFNDDFSNRFSFECPSSQSDEFIALVREMLVLYNSQEQKYFGCMFNPGGETNIKWQLPILQTVDPVDKFIPYHFYRQNVILSVAVISGGKTGLFSYTPSNQPTSLSIMDITVKSNLVDHQIDPISGSMKIIYDSFQKLLKTFRGQEQDLESMEFPTGDTKFVELVTLQDNIMAIIILEQDMKSGDIFLGSNYNLFAIIEEIKLESSTIPYEIKTDNTLNFVVLGQKYLYWLNLEKFYLPRSLQITDLDIDFTSVLDIVLSGNKCVVFYNDKVDYYRIIGSELQSHINSDTSIELLFTKSFDSIEADGQYIFGLFCMCEGINRFSCFSSTLNCLIIKSAGSACGKKDPQQVVAGG